MACRSNELQLAPVTAYNVVHGTVSSLDYLSPPLMVSDNPEAVHGGNAGVLWTHTATHRHPTHRIFMWHLNETNAARIGLLIQNRNTVPDLVINNVIAEAHDSTQAGFGDRIVIGRCLADALLTVLDPGPIAGPFVVKPGEFALLAAWDWPAHQLFAAQIELQIRRPIGRQPARYNLRTVYAPTDALLLDQRGSHTNPPPQNHPRGSWPYSECWSACSEYALIGNAPPVTQTSYELIYTKRQRPPVYTTPDLFIPFRASRSSDRTAVNNVAPYGAVVHVRLPLNNRCGNPRRINLLLQAYGGGRYSGAVDFPASLRYRSFTIRGLVPQGWGGVRQLPLMPNQAANNTGTPVDLGNIVVPPGRHDVLMNLVVAGESSTPVRLLVRRLS